MIIMKILDIIIACNNEAICFSGKEGFKCIHLSKGLWFWITLLGYVKGKKPQIIILMSGVRWLY